MARNVSICWKMIVGMLLLSDLNAKVYVIFIVFLCTEKTAWLGKEKSHH